MWEWRWNMVHTLKLTAEKAAVKLISTSNKVYTTQSKDTSEKGMWWNETGKWSRYLSLGSKLFIVLKYLSLLHFALRKTHLTDGAGFYLVTNEGHLLFVVLPLCWPKTTSCQILLSGTFGFPRFQWSYSFSLSQFVFMIAHQTIEWKSEESAE